MQNLQKLKIDLIFCLGGVIFILLSMFSVQDITKLQITPRDAILVKHFLVGFFLILLGIFIYGIQYWSTPMSWTAITKIKRGKDFINVKIGHAKLELCFGKIQDSIISNPNYLFALPANDLLDDECITDGRSSLGAFISKEFPNMVNEVVDLTKKKLEENEFFGNFDSSSGKKRYEAGTTVYFNNPLGKEIKMAFVSVTSVKDHEGIRCEASYIIRAMKGIHRLMNIKRLEDLVIPLIGSGHGGLKPQLSLICMLISIVECLREPSGCHIKNVKIVVYRDDKSKKSIISRWRAQRLLAYALRYF